ncbi:MAG TPA: cupin domain-containing protein [Eudoraea sp.]|nr:cupin domain-containing protein [Eudoraea sp.]
MNRKHERIVNTANSEHYKWGDNCDAWHYMKNENLSVIREKMPEGTSEELHYHEKAQQFFYIINGVAEFELDNNRFKAPQGSGIHIPPLTEHRIINIGASCLEFIVISHPIAHGDRRNLNNETRNNNH